MRTSDKSRTTAETEISVRFTLDGEGICEAQTGIGFFDHMLSAMTRHGLFDLQVFCTGDTEVDAHHSVEDTGIVMGEAFAQALGDKYSITRFGHALLPMDEALALVAVDISGRPYLAYDAEFLTERTGDFEACLLEEFLRGFAFAAGITLHVKLISGRNTHHIIECIMKGLGRALSDAVRIDPRVSGVPSTKGVL